MTILVKQQQNATTYTVEDTAQDALHGVWGGLSRMKIRALLIFLGPAFADVKVMATRTDPALVKTCNWLKERGFTVHLRFRIPDASDQTTPARTPRRAARRVPDAPRKPVTAADDSTLRRSARVARRLF